MQPFELSLAEAARAVRARELSPVELTESVLARIAAVDGRLRAYVTVAADAALAEAVRAEREISATGPRSPLHGIPMGLKDLIDAAGLPTTASSDVRAGHLADHDSQVAARLKAAGAVLLGKTHTHEFAYGLTTPQTSQRLGPEPRRRRVERRLGGGGRRGRGDVRPGHRHGRVHQGPRRTQRRGGPQADLRSRPPFRCDLAVLVPGPRRSHHPQCAGRGSGAGRDSRVRPARSGECVRPLDGLHRRR